ncbi:GNAT family N-acetyltransferase [Paenibacillus physcomitrellae]|uniref:N-acetyltransferase n=1 Tax=Paenibacillus physcomitrellae TaxID=1619311 RepID=A0ABQ1FNU3_9BACL|nr:GNAT family protein [Paenibacillus physcomitrellae]GGA24274.1 N-acetyltransferase [Paenibacillus physcomitrellae]
MTTNFQFRPMDEPCARQISTWTYEPPYALYSWDGSEENIAELMSGAFWTATAREGAEIKAQSQIQSKIEKKQPDEAGDEAEDEELSGFMCTGETARVPGGYPLGIYDEPGFLDLGLSLKPELTGKGIGVPFVQACIQFARTQMGATGIQLVVAAFNERAITVYERAGFVRGVRFKSRIESEELDFYVMRLTQTTAVHVNS